MYRYRSEVSSRLSAFPQLLSGEQLSFLLLSGGVEPPHWSTALRIKRSHQLLAGVAPTVLTATHDHSEYHVSSIRAGESRLLTDRSAHLVLVLIIIMPLANVLIGAPVRIRDDES